MDELVAVVEELAVQVFFDEAEHTLEKRVEGLLVRPDRGDADLRTLEQVLITDFGGGNVELVPDAALQALDDHPLLFQAAAPGQMQVEDRVRNHHAREP